MTPDERRSALEAIANEVRVCDRCRLAQGRTQAVPGEGHPDTEVVFVGEGPGQREDEQGRPFVGAAGNLLGELLGFVGWKRDEVFITNVVKCRPPGNRDPEPDEIEACRPYLRRQLEAIDPALVVTLGRFSLQSFMPGARISQAHGTERPVDPATGATSARAYAMYHPAAALRQALAEDDDGTGHGGHPRRAPAGPVSEARPRGRHRTRGRGVTPARSDGRAVRREPAGRSRGPGRRGTTAGPPLMVVRP